MSISSVLNYFRSYIPTNISTQSNSETTELTSANHTKARGKHPQYPERFPVADEQVSFAVNYPEYSPVNFTHPAVLANDHTKKPGGWADPDNFDLMKGKPFTSYTGEIALDSDGKPLNPKGRTGMIGRGLLGKWGANYAADPVVTRINSATGEFEVILIKRGDTGEFAIPGGMVDEGESISMTLKRELNEESSASVDFEHAEIIYKGYCDDPRNTDHSWTETYVAHVHVNKEITLKAGDDATHAEWIPINTQTTGSLYASHTEFLKKTVLNFMAKPEFSQCSNKADLMEFVGRTNLNPSNKV